MDQMFPSMVNDGMPKGSQHSDLSDYMVLLDEQIDRLKQERLEKARTREQIDLAIRRMENPDEQRVLRLRYLWGLNWSVISSVWETNADMIGSFHLPPYIVYLPGLNSPAASEHSSVGESSLMSRQGRRFESFCSDWI